MPAEVSVEVAVDEDVVDEVLMPLSVEVVIVPVEDVDDAELMPVPVLVAVVMVEDADAVLMPVPVSVAIEAEEDANDAVSTPVLDSVEIVTEADVDDAIPVPVLVLVGFVAEDDPDDTVSTSVLAVLDEELVCSVMLDDKLVWIVALEEIAELEVSTTSVVCVCVAVEETVGALVFTLSMVVLLLGRLPHLLAASTWRAPMRTKVANCTVKRMFALAL